MRFRHHAIALLVLLLLLPTSLRAQSLEGYVTGGLGGWVHDTGGRGTLLAAAGGAEWLAASHLGVAGEGGVLLSPRGDIAATSGIDVRWHLLGTRADRRWAPYAFAGASPLRFLELSDQGWQVGAGVDSRLGPRRAVRIEVRDILRTSGLVSSHYWTLRVGLTFR